MDAFRLEALPDWEPPRAATKVPRRDPFSAERLDELCNINVEALVAELSNEDKTTNVQIVENYKNMYATHFPKKLTDKDNAVKYNLFEYRRIGYLPGKQDELRKFSAQKQQEIMQKYNISESDMQNYKKAWIREVANKQEFPKFAVELRPLNGQSVMTINHAQAGNPGTDSNRCPHCVDGDYKRDEGVYVVTSKPDPIHEVGLRIPCMLHSDLVADVANPEHFAHLPPGSFRAIIVGREINVWSYLSHEIILAWRGLLKEGGWIVMVDAKTNWREHIVYDPYFWAYLGFKPMTDSSAQDAVAKIDQTVIVQSSLVVEYAGSSLVDYETAFSKDIAPLRNISCPTEFARYVVQKTATAKVRMKLPKDAFKSWMWVVGLSNILRNYPRVLRGSLSISSVQRSMRYLLAHLHAALREENDGPIFEIETDMALGDVIEAERQDLENIAQGPLAKVMAELIVRKRPLRVSWQVISGAV